MLKSAVKRLRHDPCDLAALSERQAYVVIALVS